MISKEFSNLQLRLLHFVYSLYPRADWCRKCLLFRKVDIEALEKLLLRRYWRLALKLWEGNFWPAFATLNVPDFSQCI